MKNTDILIIGGSAAGMVAALTAKMAWPEAEITLVEKNKDAMVPCGIPYIFGTLASVNENIMPVRAMLEKAGIEMISNQAIVIDYLGKKIALADDEMIRYQKLILATGSYPVKPAWLNGTDFRNVFTIPKEKEYLEAMKSTMKGCKQVVIVGAGFIGVEVADELAKSGISVTIVEKMPAILSTAFDVELSGKISEILIERGSKILTGYGIKEIVGSAGKAAKVILENDEEIPCDAVILSMGYSPNSGLAQSSGIPVNEDNFIIVDEYMRTLAPDVFAIGDCSEKRDFITRKHTQVMLASTACAEARVAALNLFNLHVVKMFNGTIAIYSTALGDHGFGTAGITEKRAKEEGIAVITGLFEGIDRHPGKLPDAHKQVVKLIAARESGVIIGGEVIGGVSAGELTNVIGLAIENKMTVYNLLLSQIGTHPCLTASPAGYPLIKAAEIIVTKMRERKSEYA